MMNILMHFEGRDGLTENKNTQSKGHAPYIIMSQRLPKSYLHLHPAIQNLLYELQNLLYELFPRAMCTFNFCFARLWTQGTMSEYAMARCSPGRCAVADVIAAIEMQSQQADGPDAVLADAIVALVADMIAAMKMQSQQADGPTDIELQSWLAAMKMQSR